MVDNTELIYIEQTRTTFHIRPDKIAVETPLQFFVIRPTTRYQHKKYNDVIELIRLGQVKSCAQLMGDYSRCVQLVYYQKSWFYPK